MLLVFFAACAYLTYSPDDTSYFWIYWVRKKAAKAMFFILFRVQFTVFTLMGFGFIVDVLFCDQMSFLYDPNFAVSGNSTTQCSVFKHLIQNWQRKVDMAY